MSRPPASIVKTFEAALELPASAGLPMSLPLHGDGNADCARAVESKITDRTNHVRATRQATARTGISSRSTPSQWGTERLSNSDAEIEMMPSLTPEPEPCR